MSLGTRSLEEGATLDEPIDEEKRGKFLARCVWLLGQVATAEYARELIDLGDELQAAGLVLRGEQDLEIFLQ